MINITAKKNPKKIVTKEIAYKPHPHSAVHIIYYIILHVQMFSNSNKKWVNPPKLFYGSGHMYGWIKSLPIICIFNTLVYVNFNALYFY